MKKAFQKSVSVILILTLLLSVLSSCGGNTEDETKGNTTQSEDVNKDTPDKDKDDKDSHNSSDGEQVASNGNGGSSSENNSGSGSSGSSGSSSDKNTSTDKTDSGSSADKNEQGNESGGSSGNGPVTDKPSIEDDEDEDATPVSFNYYLIKYGYPDSMTDEDKAQTYFPDERLLPAGEMIYSIPVPVREGYVFSGWYYDSDLAMLVPVDAVVENNVTLYPSLIPATDSDLVTTKSAVNFVSVIDAEVTHRVTVQAPSKQAVEEGLSLISVSEGNAEQDFTVADNGDGTYTVTPVNTLKAGKTYQYCATDREKGIQADGKVPSEDEYVLFIYNGDVQSRDIRFYNIFTSKQEVNNLRIDDEVTFLDYDLVKNFGLSEAAGLYTLRMTANGETSLEDKATSGTFTYEGDLQIGEIVAVYNGSINTEERTIDDGDVAYVKITDKNGSVYSYVSAKAEEVVFLPDVIPVAKSEDTDSNPNTLTVKNSVLDFRDFENQEVLNSKTKVNVDDYVAIYEGNLGEAKEAQYGKITKVEKGDEFTVITFESATQEEIKASLDTYVVNGIDMSLESSELNGIEDDILEQAIDSDFSSQAALYMAENVLNIEDAELGEVYPINEQQMELFGIDVEAGNLMWQVRLDPPDINADVTTKLKKVTQVNRATGLRVEFGVTIPIGLELVENGIRVIESYNLDLYVTFEQEVAISTRFNVDVKWDNFIYIVWWITDVQADATFEIGTYTGVGAIVSVNTGKYHEKSYIWNELVEDTDGGMYSSASSIATRLNDMLKDGNLAFFEGKNGDALLDEYRKMLEREVDYVDILAIRLYHHKGYMDPKTHLVNYVLDIELVLTAKLNITMGIGFENLNVKQYSFYMSLFDSTATTSVVDKQAPYSNFNFFIMGNLGLRAGIRVTFSVGLISVKLDNLGAMAEVGVFVDLYGFFYFHYDWDGATNKTTVHTGGGLYTVVGIYLDIDLFGGVLFDLATFTLHLYENEWPIWQSNNQLSIVAVEDMSRTVYMRAKTQKIPDYYFKLVNMDMTTGKTSPVTVSRKDFNVKVLNDEKFSYNNNTGEITVHPEYEDIHLSTELIFTYKGKNATFSTQPLTITVEAKWVKTEPSSRIYFDGFAYEYDDGCVSYNVIETLEFVQGSVITGVPRNVTTSRPGYDFVDWRISCEELPEYDGKLLSEVNYLEGVIMPPTYISLSPVWKQREDVLCTVQHYVQSTEDPTKYELYREEEHLGKPGGKIQNTFYDYIMNETGITIEWKKLPVYFDFLVDGQRYIYHGMYVKGDGTTVLKLYYTRDEYTVAFNVNNADYSDYYEGDEAQVHNMLFGQKMIDTGFDELEIPGYKFLGWSTSSDGSDGIMQTLPETMPYLGFRKQIQYYAIWEGEEREISVDYFMVDPHGEYHYVSTEVKTVKVGSEINEVLLWYEDSTGLENGMIIDIKLYYPTGELYTKDTIDAAESFTAKAYLTRKYYVVNWDYESTDYYWYGQTLTFPENEKEGYVFLGWRSLDTDDENIYKPGDTVEMNFTGQYYVSVFAPRTDTPYTVKHIRADLYGSFDSEQAQVEIETFTGESDSKVTPEVKSYVGFQAPYERVVTIAPDGSTEVIYKYARKTYDVIINMDGGRLSGFYPANYTYGVGFYLFENSFSARKDGFEFVGFYVEGDESKTPISSDYWISGDLLLSDKPLTFVAIWQEVDYEYKVEHYIENLDGSFSLQQTDSLYGSYQNTVTAVPTEFIGFTFNEEIEGTVKTGAIPGETETLVLKLYYARNEYEARWYDCDGTLLTTSVHKYQQVITVPENIQPSREGYTFGGWNIGTVEITTAGAEFNAKEQGIWTANTYNVEFNSNGGEGTMAAQLFTYDEAQTLSPNAFTRNGHVFLGWSDKADGSVIYNDQAEVKNLLAGGTVTLYAQWEVGEAVEYKVVYYGENLAGDGYEAIKTEIYSGITNSLISVQAITIEGFTFDENNANNVTSGTILGDGSFEMALYYTRNSYELTFDFAGETMKQVVDGEITGFQIANTVATVKYGADIEAEISMIIVGEYAGYTFGGWGTYPQAMGAQPLTLTAVWNPIDITVSYYPGPDWFSQSTTATQTVFTYKYGDEIPAPDVEYVSSSGYDVIGWVFNDGSGGQGQYPTLTGWPLVLVYDYYSGDFISEGDEALDLSPFWSNGYVTVSFNSNGGVGTMADQRFDTYAGVLPLNENRFTREGYEFIGWNVAQDGSGESYADKQSFDMLSSLEEGDSVILYAQWKKIDE